MAITEIRRTGRTFDAGAGKKFTVQYTVYLDGDTIVDIRNGNGFSAERDSECWEYFTAMVPKWRQMKKIPA